MAEDDLLLNLLVFNVSLCGVNVCSSWHSSIVKARKEFHVGVAGITSEFNSQTCFETEKHNLSYQTLCKKKKGVQRLHPYMHKAPPTDNLGNFMLDIGAHQNLQVFWGLCNMSVEKDR